MIRTILLSAALAVVLAPAAEAQGSKSKSSKAAKSQSTSKAGAKGAAKGAAAAAGGGKPVLVASFGDWGAYMSQRGKSKVCYALAQPKERQPSSLKRDAGYVFISTRPAEGVRGEISIMMGFPLKEGAAGGSASVGSANFDLVAKGENAWVKNAAEEAQLADAMRKGSRLVIKAPSSKGNVTTDTYSLNGLGQALDRVHKECQ